ncbi:sigma-70 family RNA polymerase sigma factor [Bacillus haynesii]|uniref:Sigma-70 family RNA polymerase sigma factor n=1 Tax=Bacillus haynesii TaxID=1925021 RepID=A0AA90EAD1_9BACI|nr:sigma-70 family RNA polymerase sigma factor [Bacillus haynesii]MCY7789709.1 sigma-70 family RNA polymerase sigma factor [Bacillus haynesii]MCY7847855.1 sigma-70 family RNA polymerase sigma factor [Bacillus haynesii]MCY7862186.1 sigma-70 family RNA polymerase sigma factor [Bacillus haynesii]MCY8004321.1 sigma-70 family RNA polymerase sigma factor [Bacillus haynesii]MCY8065768.1 sigma-70 family RNA polymerase sigma factor [Bacillus haynesii]
MFEGGAAVKQIRLVKKAVAGNAKAFEMLFQKHSDQLYRTAYIYVRNKEDALDIVQETAYKAFLSIAQLRNPEYFLTWLTKILIHQAYALLDKKKKVVLMDRPLQDEGREQEMHADDRMGMLEAVQQLRKEYQTAIILFYYHDLPIHDIAGVMNAPEGTVKTYLKRAKLELKQLLTGGEDAWTNNGSKTK